MSLPLERIILNSGLLRTRGLDTPIRNELDSPLPSHNMFSADSHTLPAIDLNSACLGEQVVSACRDWGLFQVHNHGIPQELLNRMRAHAHFFFQLPLQQKERVAACKSSNFYGYGVAKARTYFPNDWMEAFDMEWTPVSRVRHHMQQVGLVHARYEDFCAVVEDYASMTEKLAIQLTQQVALGLGLDAKAFTRHFEESTTSTVRMNYYPPHPNPSGTLGISPHTDFNIFTILLQDTVSGLQVLKDGKWITVKPSQDALVINVGDTFQAWSNGRIKSAMHRALVNATEPRLTVVHFVGPHPDTVIVPPAALIDSDHPLRYKAFAYKQMVEQIMHIRGKSVFESPLTSFLL